MDKLAGTAAPGAASADTVSAMAAQRAGEIGTDVPNLGTSQAIGWRTPGVPESAWDWTKNQASGLSDVKLSDIKQGMDVANATSQLTRTGIDAVKGPGVTPSPMAPRPQGTPYAGATAKQFGGTNEMTLRQLLALMGRG